MNNDKKILRELALKVAEIASLPIQSERLKSYKALNALKPVRPMFMIDQLPWGELNVDDEMTCLCEDPLCKQFEWQLRETIYRFTHMPDDRVVTADFKVSKSVTSTGYGLTSDVEYIGLSQRYTNVIKTEEDLEKIQYPVVTENKEASANTLNIAHDIFDGILNVRQCGNGGIVYGHVWDVISFMRGVEDCIIDIMDRPEFVHKMVAKFFDVFLKRLDQNEELGLIDVGAPTIHCTGAYTDELPGFNGESDAELEQYCYSAKNSWTMGAAQLFSMVSPEHHDEFEIAYQQKWYARFGLGYYGCCEPLDWKIGVIGKIPNVRKISMSPWVNLERGSEAMNGRYVFSNKPNPAFLANDVAWDADLVRRELQAACDAAAKYGNPCELILKDVSTVGNKPQRLWEWAKIAGEICNL
ncbi:MAG: hypothetical protein FWF15_04805 [Oscillospiraceae bacterium]|nr:hypothetical protein [Oscillospiraceae bacterium]